MVAARLLRSACDRLEKIKAARLSEGNKATSAWRARPTRPLEPVTSVVCLAEKGKLTMASLSVLISPFESSLSEGRPMYKPRVWMASAAGNVLVPTPHAADHVSDGDLQTGCRAKFPEITGRVSTPWAARCWKKAACW